MPALAGLARLDARALGLACGLVCGLWFWLATIVLVLRGGAPSGPTLSLLAQYFVGYSVTPAGSLLALLYGGAAGFVAGYLFARGRNVLVRFALRCLHRRAERAAAADLLDRLT